ncbi:acidic mammalian chitinase-like [Solea solea]|uniref:acidic mammalian chitinase-like n=1 Tax=Solea solea TaxID=90069 RepID=UPI00272A5BBC|nr:acidic mammalian chitinase-like [Solea solea]
MNKFILIAGLCLTITSLACSSKLVCYVTSWSVYRQTLGKFTTSNIDPNLCTHLIFAFADMSNNQLVARNSDDEIYLNDLSLLREENPHLPVLVAIGGAVFDNNKFINMASHTESRKTFIESTIQFLRERDFNGINLDWEYPQSAHKDMFSILCQDLYKAFVAEATLNGLPRLLVTAAVTAYKPYIDNGYDVPFISSYLDFINVMTFDMHGVWDGVTGHHSPLYKRSKDKGTSAFKNAEYAMTYWRDSGAPSEKLIMGFGAYGRTFTLSTFNSDFGAPISGAGQAGPYTKAPGFWAYYEVCDHLKTGTVMWSEEQKVPYGIKENQWVGYDDKMSIDYKVDFIKEKNFGGGFVWSLDLDDFNGAFCDLGKYPLVQHLHNLLIEPLSTTTTTCTTTCTTTTATTTISTTTTHTSTPPTSTPTTTTTPTPTPTSTTTTSADEESNFCVGKDNGQYAIPGSPGSYYNCGDEITHIQHCFTNLIFSESCHCCTWP